MAERIDMNPAYWQVVHGGMMAVNQTGGTGADAFKGALYTSAGKTGTAHSDNEPRPYAWSPAYAREPPLPVGVFIEDAEIPATDIAGGTVAAPVAKAVIEAMR